MRIGEARKGTHSGTEISLSKGSRASKVRNKGPGCSVQFDCATEVSVSYR